jgi:hypothetical protein
MARGLQCSCDRRLRRVAAGCGGLRRVAIDSLAVFFVFFTLTLSARLGDADRSSPRDLRNVNWNLGDSYPDSMSKWPPILLWTLLPSASFSDFRLGRAGNYKIHDDSSVRLSSDSNDFKSV